MSVLDRLPRPILLGHRGARKYSSENTVTAFDLALEHGCDGFECDVRLSQDRRLVVCHDPNLCGLEIGKTSYEQLLSRTREKKINLTSLEEVVERYASRAYLNIELKVAGGEELTLEALRKDSLSRGCIVSSFLPVVIERFAELTCDLPLGLICENHKQLSRAADLPIQALMLERRLLSSDLLKAWLPRQKMIFAWTVNSKAEMLRLANLGIDGLISDDTALLASAFRPREGNIVHRTR